MRAVTLHRVERTAAVLVASPGRAPHERVVVWNGLPPLAVAPHESIAPVVLEGRIDGRLAYAEQVPVGIRASARPLPPALSTYVASRVHAALDALHAHGEVHGAVGLDRIALGVGGEVVLFGRGRQGGSPRIDRVACLSLFPSVAGPSRLDVAEQLSDLAAEAPLDGAEQLGAWVRSQPRIDPGVETFVLVIEEEMDAVDEIVPDLGPDRGEVGILERWAVTTHPGRTPPDITEEVSNTAPVMSITLWNLLAAPRPPAASERFAAVAAQPSRALRALLAEDAPDVLPGPLVGPVPPFVVEGPQFDDQPTMVAYSQVDDSVPAAPPRAHAPSRRVPLWAQWLVAMTLGGLITWALLQISGG